MRILPVPLNLSLTLLPGRDCRLDRPLRLRENHAAEHHFRPDAPDAGTVEGADGRLSYMFQSARLLPWRTVEENIRLVREDAPAEEVRSLITAVGLEGFERYYPGQLSGGMARRCALARAFHFGGEIFLMDEPFQGLDYGIRMEMLSMLLSIWQRERPGCFLLHMRSTKRSLWRPASPCSLRAPLQSASGLTSPARRGGTPPAPELARLRQEIIRRITGYNQSGCHGNGGPQEKVIY